MAETLRNLSKGWITSQVAYKSSVAQIDKIMVYQTFRQNRNGFALLASPIEAK